MGELFFPLAAMLATFFLIIPLLTSVSWAALRRARHRVTSWAMFGSEATFAWLVAPTLLPVVWLTSSALRESLSRHTRPCLIEHSAATSCVDALILLGLMLFLMSAMIGFRLWRETSPAGLSWVGEGHELSQRVQRVAARDRHLRSLRVLVVHAASEPMYTRGLLRPVVVVDAGFVRETDEQMLHAALLHEYAHVANLDTLRNFIVRLCLLANPARAWLKADFERWRNAREAVCDGEAVHRGGEALALAECIVRAARFRPEPRGHGVGLCGDTAIALKLRLALLLDGPSAPTSSLGHRALLFGVMFVASTPYVGGPDVLGRFHHTVEHYLHFLL